MNLENRRFRGKSTIVFMGVVACLAITLTSSLVFEGISVVYAKEYSQSSSQTSSCGNGPFASNVFCSNQETETQGDDNVISISGQSSGSDGSSTLPLHHSEDSTLPNISNEDTTNNQNSPNVLSPEDDTSTHGDPMLLVLPCCDEMPGDRTNS